MENKLRDSWLIGAQLWSKINTNLQENLYLGDSALDCKLELPLRHFEGLLETLSEKELTAVKDAVKAEVSSLGWVVKGNLSLRVNNFYGTTYLKFTFRALPSHAALVTYVQEWKSGFSSQEKLIEEKEEELQKLKTDLVNDKSFADKWLHELKLNYETEAIVNNKYPI